MTTFICCIENTGAATFVHVALFLNKLGLQNQSHHIDQLLSQPHNPRKANLCKTGNKTTIANCNNILNKTAMSVDKHMP